MGEKPEVRRSSLGVVLLLELLLLFLEFTEETCCCQLWRLREEDEERFRNMSGARWCVLLGPAVDWALLAIVL